MKAWSNRINFILIAIISFAIPLEKKVIPYAIVLYVLHFLLSGNLREKFKAILSSTYIGITSLYYLVLVIGCLYTDNLDAALFDLEVKFSLFLFPIIMVSSDLTRRQFDNVMKAYLLGCLIAFLICVIYAVHFFAATDDISVFYYNKLSVFHHPTYFSMYLNFAILLLYYYMIVDREPFKIKSTWFFVAFILLFSFAVVLLSSKIGLITLLMIIFTCTLWWFFKNRSLFPSIVVFTMLTTLIYFSFKYSNIIQARINEALVVVTNDEQSFTTTGARLIIWDLSFDLIKENPWFGSGTGDVKDDLMDRYKELGYDHLYENKLNAHNEFIQMFIAIGLIGSLSFFLYLFYPLFLRSVRLNVLYMGLIGLMVMNSLTESMIETQAGVVFYAFFNAFLYFYREKVIPFSIKRDS